MYFVLNKIHMLQTQKSVKDIQNIVYILTESLSSQ